MLAEAPRGPLYGVPVAIKDEWPLPWRAERLGAAQHLGPPPKPGESGPYRALRDAGAVIVGVGEHARVRGRKHRAHLRLRPGPQPVGHRALPRRLLERARRRRRRAAGERRGGRRRDRLDSLPGGLLRAHRPEADLRPLGDAGPPRRLHDDDRLRADVPRRRRLPAAGRRSVRRGADGRRAGRAAHRDRPRGAVGRLRPGGERGLPPGGRGASRGERRHDRRGRLRGSRARPDLLDPGRLDRGARRR